MTKHAEISGAATKITVAGQRGDATADQQHQGIAKINGKPQKNNAQSSWLELIWAVLFHPGRCLTASQTVE